MTLWFLGKLMKSAVLGAAFFVWLAGCGGSAMAQTVTVTATSGGFSLTGDVLSFDGRYLRLMSESGEVTLDYSTLTCSGEACPSVDAHAAQLRMNGAPRLADLLIPALIEGYARANSARLVRTDRPDGTSYALGIGQQSLLVDVRSTSVAEAIADIAANLADVALVDRSISASEAALLTSAGGGLAAERPQIVALDADVAIHHPALDPREIELSQIADLKEPRLAVSLADGTWQAGASVPSVRDAVLSGDADLGMLPFGMEGNATIAGLRGPCGRTIRPGRETLKTGDYTLTRPLSLLRPTRRLAPEAEDFLVWLRSGPAQSVVRRAGFVDLGAEPIGIDQQGERLAGAIAAAGPEVGLGELQRLVRILSEHDRLTPTFRFEDGSTRLTPQSQAYLLQLARDILEGVYDGAELMLVGFSDGRGPALANRELSEARAGAVRAALLQSLGDRLPATVSLTTEAFGESLPIGCDDVDWGRHLNRRVELWVGYPDASE